MKQKTEQHGCIFHHQKTDKPCLWITKYNENWKNKDDPNLFRIKSADDIPDFFPFDLAETTVAGYFLDRHEIGDKEAIYFYLAAFFTDKAERDDFWMFFLPSGFPKELEK